MKVATLHAALGSAALLLLAQPAGATHSHHFAHSQFHAKKHANAQEHQHRHLTEARDGVQKRGTCSLPDHPDLVTIPGASNNGFAMSPDQPCTAGTYCPIACVPGKVMNQWKPNTTYTYPESMVSFRSASGSEYSGADVIEGRRSGMSRRRACEAVSRRAVLRGRH